MSKELPLVTFALFAHNQEKYIRDAVEAALAQDYENLEILISDDCSTDQTWSIIEEVVGATSCRHQVALNRNQENLGICAHVNKVLGLARGELIVVAAGDDISVHDRTRKVVEVWVKHGKPAAALHSDYYYYDVPGEVIKSRAAVVPYSWETLVTSGCHAIICGATAAYSRSLVSAFPPLKGMVEDLPMTFRALLLGELIHVDAPLVLYRRGIGITRALKRSNPGGAQLYFERRASTLQQILSDIEYCADRLPVQKCVELRSVLAASIARNSRGCMLGGGVIKDISIIMRLPLSWRNRLTMMYRYFGIDDAVAKLRV